MLNIRLSQDDDIEEWSKECLQFVKHWVTRRLPTVMAQDLSGDIFPTKEFDSESATEISSGVIHETLLANNGI